MKEPLVTPRPPLDAASGVALGMASRDVCMAALQQMRQHARGLGEFAATLSYQEQSLTKQLEALWETSGGAGDSHELLVATPPALPPALRPPAPLPPAEAAEHPQPWIVWSRHHQLLSQASSLDFSSFSKESERLQHGDALLTPLTASPRPSGQSDVAHVPSYRAMAPGTPREPEPKRATASVGARREVAYITQDSQSSMMSNVLIELAQVWAEMMDRRRPTIGRTTTQRMQANGARATPTRTLRNRSRSGSQTFIFDELMQLRKLLPLHPFGWIRFLWDILTIIVILLDAAIIPLRAFDLPMRTFFPMMTQFLLIFWVLDLIASCITGYQKEGVVVLRFRKILRSYARTWLAFDVAMIALDTAHVLMTNWSSTWSFNSFASFLSVSRLLRVSKLPVKLGHALERASSEMNIILIDISKLIFFILFANHVIACTWYKIGMWAAREGEQDTWVKQFELEGRPWGYRYSTALHWSLTQFTPASMEVVPTNTTERGFTVLVVTFALISFSSVVSSITNATTRLRYLHQDKLAEYSLLRKYLAERSVRADMVGGIWAHIDRAWTESRGWTHESQVKMLELLPRSLHSDLQQEIYFPIFTEHPLFLTFALTYDVGMRRLYQAALKEVSLSLGMELFNGGDHALYMYFVASGELDYEPIERDDQSVHTARSMGSRSSMEASHANYVVKSQRSDFDGLPVPVGQWISEPVLWAARWDHQGVLAARRQSEVVGISADRFQRLLKKELTYVWQINRYANAFVEALRKVPDYQATDLWGNFERLEDMVRTAFQQ